MKEIIFTFIGISTILLAITPSVFAANNVSISNNGKEAKSTVNVETNTGNNTICVNGKCKTSGGNSGKSTVCINGKCTISDGDINVQSEDGTAKVNIYNNKSSVKVVQKSENRTSTKVNQQTQGVSTDSKKDEAKKKAEETVEKAKEKSEKVRKEAEDKKFSFNKFVEKQLEFLRDIVTFRFLFGNS